jgi:hypothetical protein
METILDCGHVPSPHADFTTGYGIDSDGKKHCYQCCADREQKRMQETGRATLYLTRDSDGSHAITDWPGLLRIHPYHIKHGRHNIARTRTDAWFSFDGKPWHGVSYGENTQIIHCKRIK